MSKFEDVDLKYSLVLKKIEHLRKLGISESNIEMQRAKLELRDLLAIKKKNSTSMEKIVPRLTGIKTITFKEKNLGNIDISNKYVVLGMIIGVIAIVYLCYIKQ